MAILLPTVDGRFIQCSMTSSLDSSMGIAQFWYATSLRYDAHPDRNGKHIHTPRPNDLLERLSWRGERQKKPIKKQLKKKDNGRFSVSRNCTHTKSFFKQFPGLWATGVPETGSRVSRSTWLRLLASPDFAKAEQTRRQPTTFCLCFDVYVRFLLFSGILLSSKKI